MRHRRHDRIQAFPGKTLSEYLDPVDDLLEKEERTLTSLVGAVIPGDFCVSETTHVSQ